MSSLCINAELLKMMQNVRNIDRLGYTAVSAEI